MESPEQVPQLIVVLGMHRSGTSALARGLRTLGVDLGDRLQPAKEGVNDKGFWEDIDFVALNSEMLSALGYDWHSVTPLEPADVESLCSRGYLSKALELLRVKIGESERFGFKDPRTSKLLPFWSRVFRASALDVRYILAIRNPMSVVASLSRRDNLEAESSYLLWADHVIAALSSLDGRPVIAMDYDELIRNPDAELTRLGCWLGVEVEASGLAQYREHFLEADLRHSLFKAKDIAADVSATPLVRNIYSFLADVLAGRTRLEEATISRLLRDWQAEIIELRPVLKLTDKLQRHIFEKDNAIAGLNSALKKNEDRIADLSQNLSERDAALKKNADRIADLSQNLSERDAALAEKDATLIEQEKELFRTSAQLNAILSSKSWQLTKPMRFIQRNAFSKLSNLRVLLARALRRIWTRMPIAAGRKDSLKRLAFTRAPYLFRSTNAYRSWQMVNPGTIDNSDHVLRKDDIERILFDDTKDGFIPYRKNNPTCSHVKVIAFYLPQFHPFPENDKWWGKGFTEWTNVGKALPNYAGHYQPHCPIHFGYYDLRIPQVMRDQAELAKNYGLYGFNYYFYWFAGKILMDGPLEMMLADKSIDMPFCLTWANENWTRRWDGQENDVLIAQNHSPEDSLDFIRHLIKYFHDDRYIRIDNKPVLMVYRANIIPDMAETATLWRQELERHGFDGLYLICAQTFGIRSPAEFGFDASAEFPPHTARSPEISGHLEISNPDFRGQIYSYDRVVDLALTDQEPDYKVFRTAMLSWDNTARKQDNSHIFHGFSLLKYKQWLSALCHSVNRNTKYSADEKIVFVNAWNEWAEGTHLEPDRKFGYGYLQTLYDVVSEFDVTHPSSKDQPVVKRNEHAIIVHAHYESVVPEIIDQIRNIEIEADLFVTSSRADLLNQFLNVFPNANVRLVENRGRDILPFLMVYREIADLNYKAICKIHTKKSVYRDDGDQIRDDLYRALIGDNDKLRHIVASFDSDSRIGLLVPAKYLLEHDDRNMYYGKETVRDVSSELGLEFKFSRFPAGSMFWFNPDALRPLLKLDHRRFQHEMGFVDGTVAHAVERLFALVAESSGFETRPL